MTQSELSLAYEKYYDLCELANKIPMTYQQWLATQSQ